MTELEYPEWWATAALGGMAILIGAYFYLSYLEGRAREHLKRS